MDVGRAFQYIADDEKWLKKLLIGMVVSLIPILNFAAFGYAVQVTRNVAAGMERPLPDWDRLGHYLKNGLRIVIAFFVYMLPIFFLYFCFALILAFTGAFSESGSSGPPPAVLVVFPMLMLCIMPYALLLNLMAPAFFIQVARRESIAACFQLRDIWQMITAKLDNYILIIALYFGLNMLAGFLLMPVYFVFFFLGPLMGTTLPEGVIVFGFLLVMGVAMVVSVLARFLVFLVVGHLEGQYIRLIEGKSKGLMSDA